VLREAYRLPTAYCLMPTAYCLLPPREGLSGLFEPEMECAVGGEPRKPDPEARGGTPTVKQPIATSYE
jgi:hypothetical protein